MESKNLLSEALSSQKRMHANKHSIRYSPLPTKKNLQKWGCCTALLVYSSVPQIIEILLCLHASRSWFLLCLFSNPALQTESVVCFHCTLWFCLSQEVPWQTACSPNKSYLQRERYKSSATLALWYCLYTRCDSRLRTTHKPHQNWLILEFW